jgi:phosphatidate cytidylyltransferase
MFFKAKQSQDSQRIISAAILIPIVILAIVYLPTASFSLIVAVVLSIAAWEWSKLAYIEKIWQRILYIGLLWWGFAVAQLLTGGIILIISFLWWLLVLLLILSYPQINEKFFHGWVSCLLSFLVFVPCLVAINMLHRVGALYLLLVLGIIWSADIGAYVAGMLWGKHKLAVQISPKKTIEGLGGGILLACVLAMIIGLFAKVPFNRWLAWAGIVIMTVLFSVLGDLFESMLKRKAGVKDSGYLIPGHGGVLDRIDSLTAAIPVFALGLLLLN